MNPRRTYASSRTSPRRRLQTPPRPTGLSAVAPAGGTRLGKGLAEPTPTPRAGHTLARLSPATPTVTTRRRAKTVPIWRLHRGGRGLRQGPRRCAALRSRRRRRHRWPLTKARLGTPLCSASEDRRRVGAKSHSAFHRDTTKPITVNTAEDPTHPRRETRRRSLADSCSDSILLRKRDRVSFVAKPW